MSLICAHPFKSRTIIIRSREEEEEKEKSAEKEKLNQLQSLDPGDGELIDFLFSILFHRSRKKKKKFEIPTLTSFVYVKSNS